MLACNFFVVTPVQYHASATSQYKWLSFHCHTSSHGKTRNHGAHLQASGFHSVLASWPSARMRSEGICTCFVILSVCVLLSISPHDSLIALKLNPRVQHHVSVQPYVGFSLKLLRLRTRPSNTSKRANIHASTCLQSANLLGTMQLMQKFQHHKQFCGHRHASL